MDLLNLLWWVLFCNFCEGLVQIVSVCVFDMNVCDDVEWYQDYGFVGNLVDG